MKQIRNMVQAGIGVLAAIGLALTWGISAAAKTLAEDDHPPSPEGYGTAGSGHDHTESSANGREGHEDEDEERGAEADDHAGHDHVVEAEELGEGSDDHAASGPEDHGEHEDEGLRLTAEQRARFGIVVREAGPGSLHNEIRLSGGIVFNEDRVVHIVPPVPGVAREVLKSVGDGVRAGDVLARVDGAELASAKLDYIAAKTELGCCQFELPRAQAIHDNAVKMLALLESAPSVDQLRHSLSGEMGEYGTRLVSAYAEYVRTSKSYERERVLLEKKISSEIDFLAAESEFKKAQAEYLGARDAVAFEVKQNLLEATRDRQLAELEAQTAEQRLHVFGLSEAEVVALAAGTPAAAKAETEHVCTDPDCKDCEEHRPATPEPHRAKLGWYEIKSPIDGVLVERHLTLGERVGEDSDIFTVADLDSVWANLTVHARDLVAVRRGHGVELRTEHSGAQARGKIAMVTPFLEESTRSATARVILDNSDGQWMPGTFVTGFISASEANLPVVVPRKSVQNIEGRDVVFVESEGGFEMTPVVTGRSDRDSVEVVAGLDPGTPYVSEGAFQLKAAVITSALGSHAGHGH